MKRALLFAGILLGLVGGLQPAMAAIDRSRSAWQEGCQERQVGMLDKCQLSLSADAETGE